MTNLAHVDYPHYPGSLYDCAACENECFCEGNGECVYCACVAEEERAESEGDNDIASYWGDDVYDSEVAYLNSH